MDSTTPPPPQGITVDTDRRRLDRDLIHEFLTRSYWARGISRSVVDASITNSLCFGLYESDRQIGFARLITDRATFAYLADVFVVESHRGRGLAKVLMTAILEHPEVQGLRRWLLATRDAHELYRRFGFRAPEHPERFMERRLRTR